MPVPLRIAAVVVLLSPCVSTARTWTDATGRYTIEADLVAFDDDQVILQRNADSALGSVELAQLSDADRQYVRSKDAANQAAAVIDAPQIWTLRSGLKAPGRLVDYARREVTVQRKRGKVYVNGRVFDNLPKIYQKIVPQIVAEFEQNKVNDARTLEAWLVNRKGQPQTYTVDGVLLEVESGDEYGIPFFLFSDQDLAVLQPGWEEWLAANGQYDTQQDRSFELQSLAAAYSKNAEQQQQIARLQLGMQAIDAGVSALWEVTLYPGPGTGGPPLWVAMPGRDSRAAAANALARHSGYTLGPVRRVSR